MARTKKIKPQGLTFLRSYRFKVLIPGVTRSDFVFVSSIQVAPTPVNVRMTRGLAVGDTDLVDWMSLGDDRSIYVMLLNEDHQAVVEIPLRVRPVEYEFGALDNASEEAVTETITLMHVPLPSGKERAR